MTGNLRQTWVYASTDLWELLAAFSTKDTSAPPDLFSDLFVAADDYLAVATLEPQLEQIRNDPTKARDSFLALKGTDFTSESAIVEFLESAHEVITDYDLPGYEDFFKRLVRDFLRKYNLRYRLDDPFALRFLLPGSFTNLYAELNRVNASNPHLAGLLLDFEEAFDSYARKQTESNLKTSIAKASNYVEGLASSTLGNPATGNTLGALAGRLTDWPHDKIRESLVNLYHFCCDYPAIRHGGTPASARRRLAARDSILVTLLLMSFTGYLSPQMDEQTVLGV
jgi:hypothetical protein